MSVECMVWALNDAPIPRTRRDAPSLVLTLVGLANHANPDGTDAFPAVSTLTKYTRLSESTVRRALDALEELGLITPSDPAVIAAKIKRADRRPQGWDLAIHKSYPQDEDEVSPRHPAEQDGVSTQSDGVSPRRERGVTVTPETSLTRPGTRPDPERGRERALTVVPDTAPETDGRMSSATENDDENAAMAARIVAGLDLRCDPTPRQVGQITDAIGAALARGVVPAVVAEHARRKAAEAETVKYFVRAFSAEHLPADAAPAQPAKPGIPPVCGQCDARPGDGLGLRQTTNAAGQGVLCPRCHPSAMNHPTGGAA